MKYATIKNCDIANGEGVRVSLFVSGCTHHCKNCFNSIAWDFDYGDDYTIDTINYILELLKPDYIDGLSILGGEPFEPQNQKGVYDLLLKVKELYPNKNIWCYSGYLFDKDILSDSKITTPYTKKIIEMVDILVDGRFVEELKNLNLNYRGSSNQRIIDVKESLKQGEIILSHLNN